jgi:hypothetical protein
VPEGICWIVLLQPGFHLEDGLHPVWYFVAAGLDAVRPVLTALRGNGRFQPCVPTACKRRAQRPDCTEP